LFVFEHEQTKKERKFLAISPTFTIFAHTFVRAKCPKSEKKANNADKAA